MSTGVEQTTVVREDDLIQHIEDTLVYWVWRDGRNQKVRWSDLTEQERRDVEEAEARDYYCTMFNIYA